MSNDIDYKLRFFADDRDTLEQVKDYLAQKLLRWQSRGDKTSRDLMKEFDLEHPAEVVCWGFEFGAIFKTECGYGVEVTTWANENSRNVPVSGSDGELYYLLKKFPELEIDGTFQGEFYSGEVCNYELTDFDYSAGDSDSEEEE